MSASITRLPRQPTHRSVADLVYLARSRETDSERQARVAERARAASDYHTAVAARAEAQITQSRANLYWLDALVLLIRPTT